MKNDLLSEKNTIYVHEDNGISGNTKNTLKITAQCYNSKIVFEIR